MVHRRITIAFVLIIAFALAGCVDNGDIGNAIEKWNKVADKTQEIRILEEQFEKTVTVDNVIIEAEFSKDSPDYGRLIPIIDKWQKTLDDEKKLLEDESLLISDFAGSTATLNGDAKRYADSTLFNIRETHRYATSYVDNFNKGLEAVRMNYKTLDERYYHQFEQYLNAADSDATKSNSYLDKANDDIKKLEALQ